MSEIPSHRPAMRTVAVVGVALLCAGLTLGGLDVGATGTGIIAAREATPVTEQVAAALAWAIGTVGAWLAAAAGAVLLWPLLRGEARALE